jgi:hypothetical protein
MQKNFEKKEPLKQQRKKEEKDKRNSQRLNFFNQLKYALNQQ